jgi:hypothetical protein
MVTREKVGLPSFVRDFALDWRQQRVDDKRVKTLELEMR